MHPHYTQWLQEQLDQIQQSTRRYPPRPLAEKTDADSKIFMTSPKEATMLPDPTEEKTKRGYKTRQAAPPPDSKSKPAAVITVTPDRVAKLWNVMCGGQLVIEINDDTGQIQCHISRNSLDNLIEGMIDRL